MIAARSRPNGLQTRASLAEDLAKLGIRRGDAVLVHSSLSSLGWVCGGATAVVQALLDVMGPEGTLAVPAQTAYNRDPSAWCDPNMPESWWPTIREHLPAYDPALTPSHAVGAIAERVRTWPGALRSAHPQTSFAALGRHAASVIENHTLDSQLGEASPLARLEELDGRILLLGVGFDSCTAFHLGEYRLPEPQWRTNSCAVTGPAGRRWITYQGLALHDDDFAELGRDFETHTDAVTVGKVGAAFGRLFSLHAATEFAIKWFIANRTDAVHADRLSASPSTVLRSTPRQSKFFFLG
ncbi:MAG: aminoglycoside N(3)-acetyltransferase [Gammaproteobacteria bacterium]